MKYFILFIIFFIHLHNCIDSNDLTIIFCVKDQSFNYNLFKDVMINIPDNINVFCFITIPFYNDDDYNNLDFLEKKYSNLKVIYEEIYQKYYTTREKALLEYNITSKYIMFLEFQVFIPQGFIESFVNYFKEAHKNEIQLYNTTKSMMMFPQIREHTLSYNRPHPEYEPIVKRQEINGWHYNAKYILINSRENPKEYPIYSSDNIKYVEFVEDRCVIIDREYLLLNKDSILLPEAAYYIEHIYLALLLLVDNKTILQYPYEISYNFFKNDILENSHYIGAKWSEYNQNLAYEIHNKVYGQQTRSHVWGWKSNFKDSLYSKISYSNITKLEYYNPLHPLSNIRHGNLLASALLLSSFSNFNLINENNKTIYSNLDPFSFIQKIHSLNTNNTICNSYIYINAERKYESKIENYSNLPNISNKLDFIPKLRGKSKVTYDYKSLKGDCLYHTGYINTKLDPNIIKYYIKLQIQDNENILNDYYLWKRGPNNYKCKKQIKENEITWNNINSSTKIPFPSNKQKLLIEEFHYRFKIIKN